ncbi:MAG: hypothetical protein H0X66_00145 [Verrucomicrobia bacterium]|nr:hypothetical protein [Verrucomicrobiota bacterium]
MRTFLGFSIVYLAAFVGQSIAGAAPIATEVGKASLKSTVQIRFVDSATGYAVEPEVVSTRLHRAQAEQHFGKGQQIQPGRASMALEHGSHTITAISQHHKAMSGELNVKETQLYPIYFLLDPIEEPRELHSDYIATLQRDDAMLIQGFIVDEATGEPLRDVRVSSIPSGVNTSTDGRGFFQFHIPLPTDFASEAPNLSFEKTGYRVEDREHLELWPRGDWAYQIRLERGNGRKIIDERTSRRRAPASASLAKQEPVAQKTAVEDQPLLMSAQAFQIEAATEPGNATVRVPRNIRVEKNGVIYYVTLNYYAKRVLPSEWINSWANYTGGSNSLNAGAVVVRSYAINKINGAGASSDFDICGTSSCQVFNPTTTASASNRAVDYTDDWVMITSNGNIANTEYSAENNSIGFTCGDGFTAPSGGCLYDPACKGETRFGHGRGLCQWGSARWATGRRMAGRSSGDGTPNGFPLRDWIWILQHYYPNLTLTKGVPLMIGDDIKARVSLNVRACSDGGIENGVSCLLIATKSAGQTGTIIGGPSVVTNDGKGFTWYQVQWNDTGSTTGWSAENYLERVFPIPAAPGGLTAAAESTNRINLNWTDTGDVESRFEIERGQGSNGPWLRIASVDANVTNYSDLHLHPASQWYYRVRAVNAGGTSSYTTVANATTPGVPPVLAAISNKTVTDGTLLTFTNSATAPERVQLITDFEPFMSEMGNGVVLVRTPNFSGSTTNFLNGAPERDIAAITDIFPSGQGAVGKVLKVSCEVTNANNAWVRLTTSNTETFGNPVIDFTKKLRFDIHSDRPVKVAVGCRETTTALGTAVGANGGTTGSSIEWAGVTNVSSGAPMPNRTVSAGVWTNMSFDFSTEPIRSFSGGNGVLSTASGLGVLEHLAIVPTDGTGIYNLHLDNLAVLTPRILTYSLGAGAPVGASVHSTSGVFTWTPAVNQGGAHNISVIVADNSVPQLSATNTFSVVVNESQFAVGISSQPQDATVSVGADVTFIVEATGGALHYQWRRNGVDLPSQTSSSLSLINAQPANAGSYSVVVSNSVQSVISSDAVLTVLMPIDITSQPQSRTNNIGDNAFFSVGVTDENISYQWQFNGAELEGATTSSLNIPVDDIGRAGTYTVVLNGPSFETAVSAGAVLFIPYGNLTKLAQWNFNSNPSDNDPTTGSFSPSVGSGMVALFGGAQSVFVNGAASDPASLGLDNSSWRIDTYPASTGENKSRGIQAEVSTLGYKDIVLSWERRQQAQASRYVRLQYTVDGVDWVDHTVHEVTVAAVYFFQASEFFDIPGASDNPNFAFRIVPEWQSTATGSGASAYVSTTGGTYSSSGNMLHDMLTVLGTPLSPPVLISSPSALTNNAGETAVLTASAMRVDTVMWTRNGAPVGPGEITVEDGIITSRLTIGNVQSGHAGNYIATFFNEDAPHGIASESANLTVLLPPSVTISRVPSTLAVMAGLNVLFTASAVSEDPVEYQWLRNNEPISNATNSTLGIDPLLPGDAGNYRVAASNEQGTTLSSISSLSVLPDPNPPVAKINVPAKSQRVTDETVSSSQLAIDGTATDVERIRMVKYSINSAAYEEAAVELAANENSLTWTATIPIEIGTNILSVQAFDAAGRSSAVVTHSFFYVKPHPLDVNITGIGSISPNLNGASLEITKFYNLLAVPLTGSNYMFTNWSKGIAPNDEVIASTPLLSFAMESNLVLNANFITNPFAKAMGIYYGLFAETDTNVMRVSHASSGGFTMKVNAKSGYSGKLLLDGNAVTFSGKFALAGDAARTIARVKAGKPELHINLQLDFAGGSRKTTGVVSCLEEGWTASMEGNCLLFSAKNNNPATELIGTYTMILPGAEESSQGPTGYGYGLLTVNSNGILKVRGHLADGIKFKQAVGLTEDGTWAFYAPAYQDIEALGKPFRGSLFGWLSISSNTPVGTVHSIHTGVGVAQYAAGYTNGVTLAGSQWSVRKPSLAETNLTISFAQGIFGSSSLVKNGAMNDKGALVIDKIHNDTDRVAASVAGKTGLFKASFLRDGLAIRALGAALQDQNMAFGFFLHEGGNGSVELLPSAE